jgi:hypothetical protein
VPSVNDEVIAAALARFADQYLLGYDRAAMLKVQLPADTAEEAELDALTASVPAATDSALPDELPYPPGLLAEAPAGLRVRRLASRRYSTRNCRQSGAGGSGVAVSG